jgi:Tol biopolymer transport system component/serine/threonine protein kinase
MSGGQAHSNLIGRSFGGYRVTRFIARGGMGVVFEGIQESLDRPVAIKFLYPHLSDDEKFKERFVREARAAAGLNHPNIVRILDFGTEDSQYYMVLDLVRGESLRDRLAKIHSQGLALRAETVMSIVSQVGGALDYAHRQGYVHRDVKPGNILLSEDGRALLTDFGVVKVLDSVSQMTMTGAMIGTPEYVAPEQSVGAEIGPTADQYSLAVVIYEMMLGRVPFQAPTPAAVLRMQMSEPPPAPSSLVPWFPPDVEAVLMRALSKEPAERFPTVAAFTEQFLASMRNSAQLAGATMGTGQYLAAPGTTPGMTPISQQGRFTPPPPVPPPGPPITTSEPPPNRNRLYTVIGGGALMALLLVVAAVVFLSMNGDDDDPAATATSGIALAGADATKTAEAGAVSTEASDPSPTPAEASEPTATLEEPTATTETPIVEDPTSTSEPETTPTPESPAPDGMREVIFFSAHRGDVHDSQIYVMNPDGSDQRQVTTSRGHSWGPRVSPDGTRLMFSSVAPGEHEDHSSTGGGTSGSGNHDVYVANIDGTNISNLTFQDLSWDNGWSWSPDGKWIAFTSDRDGNWEIYKMRPDGTEVTRLTSSPSQDGWPSWTPDGQRIVFDSDRAGTSQIFIMDADGSNVRKLTDLPDTYNTYPFVSPDGSQIVFSAQNQPDYEGDIYVMDIDGGNLTRLTSTAALNYAPSWSPDGGRIVFVSDRDGDHNIYVMNADGSGQTRLTDTDGEDTTPSFAWVPVDEE